MALPSTVFTEIVTTTLREHKKYFSDNMSNNNALLNRLNKRGKMEIVDGGYEIVYPLEYAENSTYQRYSGYDTLNIQASDVLTAAKYDWKQAAVNVTASGLELRQNSGKNAILNLVKSRLNVAMKTMANNISQDIYSDGSAANQINGLQALVSDTGTGIVGGINSTVQTWWRNVVQDANAPLGGGSPVTPSKSTIRGLMNELWLELNRGADKPDLIPSSNEYFTFYWESLQDLQRYGDEQTASSGFQTLKYVTADVVFDGGSKGGGIPAAHMYFLNTDYLKWVSHRDANMSEVAEKTSVNQDSVVIPIIWQGNLCCSNRSLQGVLIDNG